jgi:hypothetical protein
MESLSIPIPPNSASHLHLLMCILIFISACSVFKEKSFFETDSLQRQKTAASMKQESHSRQDAVRMYSHTDSGDQQTFAEIIPRGAFKYSLAEGFSGEAERLLIRERQQRSSRGTGFSRSRRDERLNTDLNAKAETRTKSMLKAKVQKPRGLTLIYLAGTVLLFVLIYWCRRYLKQDGRVKGGGGRVEVAQDDHPSTSLRMTTPVLLIEAVHPRFLWFKQAYGEIFFHKVGFDLRKQKSGELICFERH